VLKFFNKLISIGIRSSYNEKQIEKTKLVNGISFMGTPICIFYALIFLLNGYYFHVFVFLLGAFVFAGTLLFNKLFGLNFARIYISLFGPLCFGFVNLISGKDAGFYMGFIVTTIPAVLIFDRIKTSLILIFISFVFLGVSIFGLQYFTPIKDDRFVMIIHLLNLFMVIIAALTVVFIFKNELNESKAKIEEKQKEILDSIHYAKRIQNTLITNKEYITKNLPSNFIYFKPKDIVSGDFYWATKKDSKFYLAVCDSTGHGVPGAFMSLLNITFLNEAINQKNISDVGEVFNYTRDKLIESLTKDGQKDGFDGILVCFDEVSKVVSYTAANNSPILISEGVINKLICDKMPVGYGERKNQFNTHTIQLKSGDSLYLYTDGYADQFGGAKGKKFKYKQLDEYLLSNAQKPLNEQCMLLDSTFEKWRGNLEQVDDVCIICIKL